MSFLVEKLPSVLAGLSMELVSWFIGFVSEVIIAPNKSAHRLKLAESKTFIWECAFDRGAVHGAIELVSIKILSLGGGQAASLMEVIPG